MRIDFKSMIIGGLLCVSLGLTAGVVQQWGSCFGPRQTAAISLVTLDQINLIRSKLPTPLQPISTNVMIQALDDKYDSLSNEFYTMERPFGGQP